jgi:hypothetical protein
VKLRRLLTAAVTGVLALGVLTACETKVGLAASAEGQRLTNSSLAGFVQPGAKPYTDNSTNPPTTVTPKLFALENWIDNQIFASTVAKHGGAATPAELSTARSAVLGSHTVADYQKFYGSQGYTKPFADLILDQSALLVVLVERLAHTSAANAIQALNSSQIGSTLLKTITATNPKVEVSPRYGAWIPSKLSLSTDPGAGAPSFVMFPGSSKTTVEPGTTP